MKNTVNLDKVYPYIKQVEGAGAGDVVTVIANDGSQARVTLPWHIWLGDLGVFYVADEGDILKMVSSEMLPDGMDETALFKLACNNLLRDIEFRLCAADWGGTGIVCGGNFEASALCCPDIWSFVARQYKEDFVVAVPARDVVIMAPVADADRMHNLKLTVDNVLSKCEHPLSAKLFYYSVEKGCFTVAKDI
ncbi:MAG: hypothetical protein IJL87_05470 [Clostridia bacterium]|nr:hypothetical protein [Clostridia bacterium]